MAFILTGTYSDGTPLQRQAYSLPSLVEMDKNPNCKLHSLARNFSMHQIMDKDPEFLRELTLTKFQLVKNQKDMGCVFIRANILQWYIYLAVDSYQSYTIKHSR